MAETCIGIAGYMGSGKSTAARVLGRVLGAPCIDADGEAKKLMEQDHAVLAEITDQFHVVEKGRIDYTRLGEIVFGDREALQRLNACVHPPLIARLNRLIRREPERIVLLDAALIPLWRPKISVDFSLWIAAPADLRAQRLYEKNGGDYSQIQRRIASQEALFSPPRESSFWSIIDNCGCREEYEEELIRLALRLIKNI
jgi:dephospho-CoA kinase